MFEFKNCLKGKTALVTGGSRGIGKGVATMLMQAGATVYITGRRNSNNQLANVELTANYLNNEFKDAKCIPIYCDHSIDKDMFELFDRIDSEVSHLDILVNSAFSGVNLMEQVRTKKFYEMEPTLWDEINRVGLRSNYFCSTLAAKKMIKSDNHSLIVNISSSGAIFPFLGVAYGVGKEGLDRMTSEMGLDLKETKITAVSLWPGIVRTEYLEQYNEKNPDNMYSNLWHHSEHPTFTGKAIVALAADPNKKKYNGKVLIVSELSDTYDFCDIDGKKPPSLRSFKFLGDFSSKGIGKYFHRSLKVPKWIINGIQNKF